MLHSILEVWPIIVGVVVTIVTIGWPLLKNHFSLKNLKAWAVRHDEADRVAFKEIRDTLKEIHTSVVELTTVNKLILSDKLKTE